MPTKIKPFLKWVGGKTQIIDKLIIEYIPKEIKNYYETFLGGGSVLFSLLSYIKNNNIKVNGKIYAFDLNEPLIFCYKNIQSQHDKLYEEIKLLIDDYNSCENDENINRDAENITDAKKSQENYYYYCRKKYNNLTREEKTSVIGSALFIFLNKTCFRGVFRIGPNGFNVPFGNYKTPEIMNRTHLNEIHDLIQPVIFECQDFVTSLSNIKDNFNKHDFVYLDPPYAPETETSFVKYTEKGFDLACHKNLFNLLQKEIPRFILSNADVSLVRDSFKHKKFTIKTISCKRSINSKNPDAKTNEVIIKNF